MRDFNSWFHQQSVWEPCIGQAAEPTTYQVSRAVLPQNDCFQEGAYLADFFCNGRFGGFELGWCWDLSLNWFTGSKASKAKGPDEERGRERGRERERERAQQNGDEPVWDSVLCGFRSVLVRSEARRLCRTVLAEIPWWLHLWCCRLAKSVLIVEKGWTRSLSCRIFRKIFNGLQPNSIACCRLL